MSEIATDPYAPASAADRVMYAACIAVMPLLFLFAPRFARHAIGKLNLRTLRTAENRAFFDRNRRYSGEDETRVQGMIDTLKARIGEDDWAGVSDLIAGLDTSREALSQSNMRLGDVALDFLRHELADQIGLPNACNSDHYYRIPDSVLARVETASRTRPDDLWLTALLAQIHIDRGWCARGGGWSHEVTEEGWQGLMDSFRTAHALLERFDPDEVRSPFYARVRFQLLATADAEGGLDEARAPYHDWSDLDIANPAPHRSFAFLALPRWFGSWPSFEAEARAAAGRTKHRLGQGAYAMFYLQAFAYDEGDALHNLDAEFFSIALDDLVRHDADPAARAAQAALTLSRVLEPEPVTLLGELFDLIANRKRDALKPLIRQLFDRYLTHLPTEEGSGAEVELLDLISEAYQPEIREGKRMIFTTEGVRWVDAPRLDA